MIVLQTAGIADLDRLFALDQVCFPRTIAYSRREFRSLLQSRTTTGIVAEESGILAGFVFAELNPEQKLAHVITLDVAPQLRFRGVGRLLMDQLESELRLAGAHVMELEVAVNNPGAQSFYVRLGFASVGEIQDYYPGSVDALVMRKRLL